MSGKGPDFGLVAVIFRFAGANVASGTQETDKCWEDNCLVGNGITLGLFSTRGLGSTKAQPDDGVAKHETLPACI